MFEALLLPPRLGLQAGGGLLTGAGAAVRLEG